MTLMSYPGVPAGTSHLPSRAKVVFCTFLFLSTAQALCHYLLQSSMNTYMASAVILTIQDTR